MITLSGECKPNVVKVIKGTKILVEIKSMQYRDKDQVRKTDPYNKEHIITTKNKKHTHTKNTQKNQKQKQNKTNTKQHK